MADHRTELRSQAKVQNALTTTTERDAATAPLDKFIDPLTMAAAIAVLAQLGIEKNARNIIKTRLGNEVDHSATDKINLTLSVNDYFKEMNLHIGPGKNPASVRALFELDEATGNLPNIDQEVELKRYALLVKTGNAAMVTGGYILNTGFPAAGVELLRLLYVPETLTKNTDKGLLGTSLAAVQGTNADAKVIADDIAHQVIHHFRHLTPGQMHVQAANWGVDFEADSVVTLLKIIVLLPDGTPGFMADIRIGPKLTADGKPAKSGVKGTADAEGQKILGTAQTGDQYVVVRRINCADSYTLITIESGVAQTIKVVLVAGISSL